MRAKNLLLFRTVLLEVLLFQILYAPGADLRDKRVWAIFLPYVAWTTALHTLDWLGRISVRRHLWFFLADIAMTSAVLYLTKGVASDLYLAYFLVILASCFLNDLRQSFIVGGVACLVYAALAFPGADAALQPHYLLRISLLLVVSFFSAYVVDQSRLQEETAHSKYAATLAWMQRLSLVGQAITNVLHEAKTPLNTIILSAESIRDIGGKDPAVSEQIELICSEAERASQILENYLEFTRPTQLELKPLSLAVPIRAVLNSMRLRIKELHIKLDERLDPDAWVLGSERHLEQAFANVVANALNAMSLGGRLSIRQWRESGKNYVSFKDTGIGISPEKLARLFKPFPAASQNTAGHGLGLGITLWIVQKHSGEIEIRSPGLRRGAEILITLPSPP